jgi:hypothetical protein
MYADVADIERKMLERVGYVVRMDATRVAKKMCQE